MLGTRTALVLILILMVAPDVSVAQESLERQGHGDTALRDSVAAQARALYEQGGTSVFVLTRGNPLQIEPSAGTEIQAVHREGEFRRIVATAWTAEGKYSVEYSLSHETPIFVYETFEYVEERAPEAAWRNFKGLAAWERRSYLDGGEVGYVETRGEATLESDAMSFRATVARLLASLGGPQD